MDLHIVKQADILLPQVKDMTAWSVVACDQFTSQRDYWEAAEERVGEAPSALRLMLPEAWLGTPRAVGARERIGATMEDYLRRGLFTKHPDCFVYLERTQPDGRVRRGLLGALDLERYDFDPAARLPVRATEGTVEDRLPPRTAIRAAAPLEMPHVLVLMDDRDDRVLGCAENARPRMKKLYDFELMLGGGRVAGWRADGPVAQAISAALDSLGDPELQREKYGAAADNGPLTLAVGDGNHSLAAAKRWWEQLRPALSDAERESHPARYALVELCSIHEPALDFEPIHRLITDTDEGAFAAALAKRRDEWEAPGLTLGERVSAADRFCAEYIAAHGGKLDYIHGDDTARELGSRPGCAAVLLPPVEKGGLFLSVLTGGVLPRKSFSMGTARDKRYYLECRAIR